MFDQHVMENLKLLAAGPEGSVLFELLIDDTYGNINGVMHGGAAGLIFDMCTTTALAPLSKPGYWLYAELHSLVLPIPLLTLKASWEASVEY